MRGVSHLVDGSGGMPEMWKRRSMRDVTTVLDPRVGDKMNCPGCGDLLTLTPMDGWGGPHVGCVGRTSHGDWIITVFSNPAQDGPLPPKCGRDEV